MGEWLRRLFDKLQLILIVNRKTVIAILLLSFASLLQVNFTLAIIYINDNSIKS